MVDLVDSIGRKLERNYISSQRPCLQIARALSLLGAPHIAGLGSSDCRGPFRLLRSSQIWRPHIAGASQTAERGPSRLLKAHQIAMGSQIAGAPQIYGSPSKFLGPSDCWEFLRLLRPCRFLEAPQNCWNPSDWWGPLRLLVIFLCMFSSSSGGDEILVSYIDLVFCNRLSGTNAINTCTFWIVKFVIVVS